MVNRNKSIRNKQVVEHIDQPLQQLIANKPSPARKRIVLVSCVSQKLSLPPKTKVRAKELYTSALFTKSWALAQRCHAHRVYILSAKHHLLHPDDLISTYNETLTNVNAAERRAWAKVVLQQLQAEGIDLKRDEFVFLAGKNYYQYLLTPDGIPKENALTPFAEYRGIGYILQALSHV